MTKAAVMLAKLREVFRYRHVDGCLHKGTDSVIFVCEATTNNEPCILRKTGEGFQIDNPTQKEIHMIVVDHCLLTNRDHAIQKCDCVIFDSSFDHF